MEKTLNSLIELQEIDLKLDSLMEERGDLPERVKELEQKITEHEDSLKNDKQRVVDLQSQTKKDELDLASQKEQLAKYEAQLYKVTTNKEYDAISNETESVKTTISSLELNILQSSEIVEELSAGIIEQEKKLVSLKEELKESDSELQQKIGSSSEEEKLLEQERLIVIKNLSRQQINAYDRIRKAKRGGRAVATSNGGVCGGCFSYIPPQKVVEIKNMKRIYYCESCGRILVWDTNA